jgi:hypothetical protein
MMSTLRTDLRNRGADKKAFEALNEKNAHIGTERYACEEYPRSIFDDRE